MVAAFVWYSWGLFLGIIVVGIFLACVSPLTPYRNYPVFRHGVTVVVTTSLVLLALIAGLTFATASFAIEHYSDTSMNLFRLLSFGSLVIFGWGLRRFIIRGYLTPPPTHPASKVMNI